VFLPSFRLNRNGTDKSDTTGAAFYGASLVPQFKTKIIKIQDIATYDIQVSYSSEAKTEGELRRISNVTWVD
jgi:hypothetical protein